MMDELNDPAVHFVGREQAWELYGGLLAMARTLGPVTEEVKKSSIYLRRRTVFANVVARRGHLVLEFKTSAPLVNERVVKTLHASATRYYCTVRVDSTDDLDAELKGWLERSYMLSG